MRVFARVVETGSFSAAGRDLGVAPSSVSRSVADLEAALGARLFQRTTRKLSLTEAGRLYHDRAARILLDVEEARLAVGQLTDAPSGLLRISLPASLASRHLIPALAAFQARYPAVKAAVAVTDRLSDLVDEGFDLALRIGTLEESSLVARKLGAARRVLCASPAYLAGHGLPESPNDLAGHSCILLRSHPGASAWTFKPRGGPKEERTLVRVSGTLIADDGPALVAAAVAGLGLALVPRWLAGAELARGELRAVLTDHASDPAETPLYAVYPSQPHLPPKVRAFIDFLVERFRGEAEWAGIPHQPK